MMSRHTAVIRTAYRAPDIRYPVFNCPVLFAARLLCYAHDSGRVCQIAGAILSEAAEVADLVERLSEPVEYIDFTVHDGYQPLALRMRVVECHGAVRVCIDLRQASGHRRPPRIAHPMPATCPMTRC